MTSLAQAKNRMLLGHRLVLERKDSGLDAFSPLQLRTAADIRGATKILRTLIRWGALDREGFITPFGRELLEASR